MFQFLRPYYACEEEIVLCHNVVLLSLLANFNPLQFRLTKKLHWIWVGSGKDDYPDLQIFVLPIHFCSERWENI